MSAELYSNGKGQYSLEQLPDFYPIDPDDIEPNVAVMQGTDRAVSAIKQLIDYSRLRKNVPDVKS